MTYFMKRGLIAALSIFGIFFTFSFVLANFHSDINYKEIFRQRLQENLQSIKKQRDALRLKQEKLKEQPLRVRNLQRESGKDLRKSLSPQELRNRAKPLIDKFRADRNWLKSKERAEEFEAKVKELREQAKEKIKQRKQEFREKLSKIKKERHRRLAERLNERINEVNQRMSNAALHYLDALELVLGKIEARTSIVEEATGADLTSVREAITQASQRIADAREAVLAQKSKEYVIDIQSQETLGKDIRKSFQELRDDHRALREEVLRPLRGLVRDVMLTMKDAVKQSGKDAQDALEQKVSEKAVESE